MRYKEFKLFEAFTRQRLERGVVPFRKNDINDPHIITAINRLATEANVPEAELIDSINKKISVYKEIQKYSPLMYNTLVENAVEDIVFTKIMSVKSAFRTTKFNIITFTKLIAEIMKEIPGMFPIKPPDVHGRLERTEIRSIKPILVPAPGPIGKRFKDITTACVTPRGEFVFNTDFMEQLITYADVIGLKPAGAKYQANGGAFPNGYAYIEFLILHEILHYKLGDFTIMSRYHKKYMGDHNFATDFRSNYILVKAGYQQLPMGLFSDDLNFDRPGTENYTKLLKAVHAELRNIPPHLRLKVEHYLDEHADPTDPKNKKPDNGEEERNPYIGKVVRIDADGTYGVIEDFNEVTEKASVRPCTPAEVKEIEEAMKRATQRG